MKVKTFALLLVVWNVLFLTSPNPLLAEVWWEETGKSYDYDLSGSRILVLLGDDFDYEETIAITQYWEKWGAEVDRAGTETELTGHLWRKTKTGWDRSEKKQLKIDLLLTQVELTSYEVLFFPGGESPRNLLTKDSSRVVQLIQEADNRELLLGAICHGPHVLAAAGVIDGVNVTGHREIAGLLADAGGNVVNEVCTVDGNIVTGNWPYFESMAVRVAEKLLYPGGGGPSEQSLFKMNPVLKTIKERRSVRRFQHRDVGPDTVETILEAAVWAPSANNDQPWKFVVVRNKETKKEIVETLMERMKDYYQTRGITLERVRAYWASVFSAPVHIFAFCDARDVDTDEDWRDIEMLHCMQGVSAACHNMLLAAQALDVGSLWMGGPLVVEDDIKTLLQIPRHVRLVAILAFGHAAHEPLPPVRKSLSNVVSHEKWEKK